MYLHPTPVTANAAALLKIGKCYVCACTGKQIQLGLQHGIGLGLNFFLFFLHHMWEWNRHIGHGALQRPACIITQQSVQATRGNGGIIIPLYLLSVFSRKKKEHIYIESSGKWAMGLPIKETIYTWRHSKHKLPLSSETESHLIFQECSLKGKLLFQYRHQRPPALVFPFCFLSTHTTHTHTHWFHLLALKIQSRCTCRKKEKKRKGKQTKQTSPVCRLGTDVLRCPFLPQKTLTSGKQPPPMVR